MRLRFEHGRDELKTLHPAYFAMVMATGITFGGPRLVMSSEPTKGMVQ